MNMLLQAGQATTAQAGGGAGFWIMIILLFVVMYFFMIRPQRKQQKELEKFRNELKKGDKIVTVGGIFGTVDEIKESYILIKVDGETKLRVSKNAIQKDYTPNA
ncbi:MAG: preprotein translocase subunit YajC [Bacteroidales bacterium]|nr:preprotein translocase subunit YajC [Bacteroidales bacterium]